MAKHMPPNDLKALDALYEDFHLTYGQTLGTWASLEEVLSYAFFALCGMDQREQLGAALFFSGRSFATRADLLSAALRVSAIDEETKAVFRAILKRARQYSTARNTIAHGIPTHYAERGLDYEGWRVKEGERTGETGGIGVWEMEVARGNFLKLAEAVLDALPLISPRLRGAATPLEQCLAQVQALPSDAFVHVKAQT